MIRPPVWPGAVLLAAAVLLAYANALAGPFQFDDWWSIVDNPAAHRVHAWWQALPGIRPLLKLVNALNWQLAPTAWSFHALNLAVHAGNSLLVLLLAHAWLPTLAPRLPAPRRAALALALLFALHPAATEAVTYISGRSISLMAFFYLAALWAQEQRRQAPQSVRWAWLAALLFASALAVRETAVTLPFALLLLAHCRGESLPRAVRRLWPMWTVLAVAVITASFVIPAYGSFFGWSLQTRDAPSQMLGQLAAHRYLLTGPALGMELNIDPDVRVPTHLDGGLLAFAVLMSGIGVIALRVRQRSPWLLFGLGWYLLHLLPSNSLLPRFDLANDRHLYLSLLGLALWLAVAIGNAPRRLAWTALAVLAIALGIVTRQRNHDYRSELALWTATVTHSPHKARPWVNLGWARQQAGDTEGAAKAYRCAIARDPSHRQARINLAALGVRELPVNACTAPSVTL